MNWISVKNRLPEIPNGKYGVSVLVAVYDPVYAEVSEDYGYDVYTANYGFVKKGEVDKDFLVLCVGGKERASWRPIMDEVTHWMPLPEPPVKNNKERRNNKDERNTGKANVYTIRFEHPLVGYKGGSVFLSLEASSCADALAKAKSHCGFMKYVSEYENKDYPIKENYFHVYESPKAKPGELRNYEGDERL